MRLREDGAPKFLDLGHRSQHPPSTVADGAEEAHHSCCEEEQRGRLGRGRLRRDGEVKVVWSRRGGELEIEESEGAGVDECCVGAGLRATGQPGDEYATGEKVTVADAIVEDKAVQGRTDAGVEGDIEGLAADAVNGAGGCDGGDGDEVKLVGEGVRGREGKGEGVGVADEGGVEGVGVGGYGENGGGEDEELG
jgi:hypothetical protein